MFTNSLLSTFQVSPSHFPVKLHPAAAPSIIAEAEGRQPGLEVMVHTALQHKALQKPFCETQIHSNR